MDGDNSGEIPVVELSQDDPRAAGLDSMNMDDGFSTGDELDNDGDCRDDAKLCFSDHKDAVFSVDISPTGQLIASGGGDDVAYLYNLQSGTKVLDCGGHKDSVSNVAFSHDGSFLATGDLAGFLQVWQLTDGRVIWSGEADSDLEWMSWNPQAPVLVAGNKKGQVWMWQIPSNRNKCLEANSIQTECGHCMLDGLHICAGYHDGVVRVWNMKTNENLSVDVGGQTHSPVLCVSSLLVTDEVGKQTIQNPVVIAAAGCENGMVTVFHPGSAKVYAKFDAGFKQEDNEMCAVEAMGFSGDGRHLATASLSGVVAVWDISKGVVLHTMAHSTGVVRLTWISNTVYIVTACLDGIVRAWDARNGQCCKELSGHRDEILDMCLSRDGSIVVSASSDKTVRAFSLS